MNHHEQHHQDKEKERREENRQRRAHEREHGKKWPVHPAWIVVIGVVLMLAAILVWTLAV